MGNDSAKVRRIPIISDLQDRVKEFKALPRKEQMRRLGDFFINNALLITIIVFVIIVACLKGRRFLINAPIDVIKRTAGTLAMALGVAGIICITGTDLSAGRILGFCACVCASLLIIPEKNKMFPNLDMMNTPLMEKAWPFIVLLLAMIIGALIGVFNGFFVAKFSLHPFIVTLATTLVLHGVVLEYLGIGEQGGLSISSGLSENYTKIITTQIRLLNMQIPLFVFYAVGLTFFMWVVWNKTTLGKNMYAIGSNPEAAKVSGVNVMGTTIALFALAGMMYGIGAFIDAARIGSASSMTGDGNELNAIAACVIGGVSFTGGVGKISGVVMGVIMIQLIDVGLLWLSVPATWTKIITGAIILFAVVLDMRKYLVKR